MEELSKIDLNKVDKQLLKSTIVKIQCQRHFYDFIPHAWPIIEQKPFKDNWHIQAMAEHLEAVYRRQIKRLIINVPPRCSKSLICAVLFPVWVWINSPQEKFLTGSHSRELAVLHARLSRILIESDWAQNYWGDKIELCADQNQKLFYENINGGNRQAFSTSGDPLGKGGSFLLLDDPIGYSDAYSKARRDSINSTIGSSVFNRLNDRINDPIIIDQQRLHPLDTTGEFINKDDWVKFILPMEFESRRRCKTFLFTDPRKKEGEILCDRFTKETIKNDKERMGLIDFNAQFQQRPEISEGNIIKISEFIKYEKYPEDIKQILQSWDTAFKTGEKNDYSVCLTIGAAANAYYLLNMFRGKLAYPELKAKAEWLAERYIPNIILIEDKASGQSLIQELKATTRLPIKPIKVDKDKVSRAHSITGLIEAGKIFIPKNKPWVHDFADEVSLFPNGAHDDIVDALTMGFNYLQKYSLGAPRVISFN